jgi:hypothetical protein
MQIPTCQMLAKACILFLAASLCACIPTRVYKTSKVEGTVSDAQTKAPIAGATAYCEEEPRGSVRTTASGVFAIPAIREWHWMLIGSDWLSRNCSLAVRAAGHVESRQRVWFGDDGEQAIYLPRSP